MFFLKKTKKLLKKIHKIIDAKSIVPKDKFSYKNFGVINHLEKSVPYKSNLGRNELIKQLINVYGINVEYPLELKNNIKGIKTYKDKIKYNGIFFDNSYFESYDGLKIPIYVLYPPNFDPKRKYPTIIIFSGHGSSIQAAFEESSYQHGAGSALAKKGFLVYVMENRGMGSISYLGSHLRIDGIARITGGSWYGEIITDGFWLIENVFNVEFVDKTRIGTAGVSSGGALSMIIAAIDERISAAYIQGYLGTFRKTFGTRANHCLCNHINGILNVCEMADIASLIAPRPALFVNGTNDTFYYLDAKNEYNKIYSTYKNKNVEAKLNFMAPEGVGHEFSINIAVKWFFEQFIENR